MKGKFLLRLEPDKEVLFDGELSLAFDYIHTHFPDEEVTIWEMQTVQGEDSEVQVPTRLGRAVLGTERILVEGAILVSEY